MGFIPGCCDSLIDAKLLIEEQTSVHKTSFDLMYFCIKRLKGYTCFLPATGARRLGEADARLFCRREAEVYPSEIRMERFCR